MANAKVGTRQERYWTARPMANELFRRGSYSRMVAASLSGGPAINLPMRGVITCLAVLQGIFAHHRLWGTASH